MTEDRIRILNMVKDGKLSPEDAGELLAALDNAEPAPVQPFAPQPAPGAAGQDHKYFRIQVEPKDGIEHRRHHRHFGKKGKVNVRIPLAILRAGVKLTTLLPQDARARIDEELGKKGIGLALADLEGAKLDPLIEALSRDPIDVDAEDATVKIYCE